MEGEKHEFSVEKRFLRPDGKSAWTTLTVSPMWSADERPAFHIAVIVDITNRKLMEKEVKTLSGLLPICASCKKNT